MRQEPYSDPGDLAGAPLPPGTGEWRGVRGLRPCWRTDGLMGLRWERPAGVQMSAFALALWLPMAWCQLTATQGGQSAAAEPPRKQTSPRRWTDSTFQNSNE